MIKDSIHGFIETSREEEKIIDTPQFQKLRHVRQLALAHLVYPGANHTRFEHSLGTMHIAGKIAERLKLDVRKARLLGLLHDLGHVAFSHESERVLSQYLGTHEEVGKKLIEKSEIADVIFSNYSKKELFSGPEMEIIDFDLGADRLDYLNRDSYYTGVAYGVIDEGRIVSTLAFGKRIYLERGGLEAAESMLIARFMMFFTVYFHKTVRIASAMLRKAIQQSISSGAIEPEDFIDGWDDEILAKLSQKNELARRILQRRLYKLAYELPFSDENAKLARQLECENVIIDLPYSVYKLRGFDVELEGKKKKIDECSVLVKDLKEAEKSKLKIFVICEESRRRKVAEEMEKMLKK
ncbi:MAG: HD domain-containing protein [Candidatus Anstonellales archaeon]